MNQHTKTRNGKAKQQRYKKKESLYKTPEGQGHQTLFSDKETTIDHNKEARENYGDYVFSYRGQADVFLATWAHANRPFKKYAGFRVLSDKIGVEQVYTRTKNFYSKYVIHQGWTEEKYVFVLDKIFSDTYGAYLSEATIGKFAFLYDHNRQPHVKENSYGGGNRTSALYSDPDKGARIEDVLSAWDALDKI